MIRAERRRVVREVEARRNPKLAQWCAERRQRIAARGLLAEELTAKKLTLRAAEWRELALQTWGIGGGLHQEPEPSRSDMYDDYYDPGPRSGVTIDVEAAPHNGNLQSAMNAAQYGDIVLCRNFLTKGSAYAPITIPSYTGRTIGPGTPLRWNGDPSYIIVKSDGAYPTDGTRVTEAAHKNACFVIQAGASPAIQTTSGNPGPINTCHHYRFEGMFLNGGGGVAQFSLATIGDLSNVATPAEADMMSLGPHHMMFVACAGRGDPDGVHGTARAFTIKSCRSIGIFDSAFPGCFEPSFESHMISGGTFRGLHVENVYGEGMTEGLCLFGTGPSQYRMPGDDIIFHRCHSKKPLRWMRDTIHAVFKSYPGTVAVSGAAVTGTSTLFASEGQDVGGGDVAIAGDYFAASGFRVATIQSVNTDTSITLTASYPTVSAGTGYVTFWRGRLCDSYVTSPVTVTISGTTVTRASGTWNAGDPVRPGPQIGDYFCRVTNQAPTRHRITAVGAGPPGTLTLATAPGDAAGIEDWYVTSYDGVHRGVSKNMMEFKMGRRIEVSACLFEHCWADGGVEGSAIVINNATDANRINTGDIRVSFCEFRHSRAAPQWQNLSGLPTGGSNVAHPGVVLVEHCLGTGLMHPALQRTPGSTFRRGTVYTDSHWTTYRHNTLIVAPSANHQSMVSTGGWVNTQFADNIIAYGLATGGISGGFVDPNTPGAFTTDGLLANRGIPQTQIDRNVFFEGSAFSEVATSGMLRGTLLSGTRYGNAGLSDIANVGFINPTKLHDGTYRLQSIATITCTVSGVTVTATSGTIPTTVQKGTPFRVSVDGMDKLTSVLSRDSTTQATLAIAYPGTTGAGLTGLFTFQGSASDGTDPGADIAQLIVRMAGVEAGARAQVVYGRPVTDLQIGLNPGITDSTSRRTLVVDDFRRRVGSGAFPDTRLDTDCDTEGWEVSDAPAPWSVRTPGAANETLGPNSQAQGIYNRGSNIRYTGVPIGAAQWAEITVGQAIPASGVDIGVTLNSSAPVPMSSANAQNGFNRDQYTFYFNAGAFNVAKISNTAGSVIGGPIAGSLVAGDRMRLEHDGLGHLTAYKNDVALVGLTNLTDPTPYTAGFPGMRTFISSNTALFGVNQFSAGDFTVTGGPTVPPPVITGQPYIALTVTVTGTATAGAIVALYINGALVSTTTAAPSGAWSIGTAPLVAGDVLTATQTTAAGTSAPSDPVIVQAPPTPPAPIITATPYHAGDTSVTGTGVVGATVTLLINGVSSGTAVVSGTGIWVKPVTALTAGQVLSARQTTAGGTGPDSASTTVLAGAGEGGTGSTGYLILEGAAFAVSGALLLETGDALLLETGDKLLLEGASRLLVERTVTAAVLLLETGDALLLENGNRVLLEGAGFAAATITDLLVLENLAAVAAAKDRRTAGDSRTGRTWRH